MRNLRYSQWWFMSSSGLRHDYSAGLRAGWWEGGSSPGRGSEFFSSPPRPELLWGPPSLSNEYNGPFPSELSGRGVKLTTHLHLVQRSKDARCYTSTSQYAFMVWCSAKAQGQLYLLYWCGRIAAFRKAMLPPSSGGGIAVTLLPSPYSYEYKQNSSFIGPEAVEVAITWELPVGTEEQYGYTHNRNRLPPKAACSFIIRYCIPYCKSVFLFPCDIWSPVPLRAHAYTHISGCFVAHSSSSVSFHLLRFSVLQTDGQRPVTVYLHSPNTFSWRGA
jgi:hypothetical protein